MNKKSRLLLILVVLGACLAFLWPSLTWYFRTSEEDQQKALWSLEKIKDYSEKCADKDVNEFIAAVKANKDAVLTEDQAWLADVAKKNYKEAKKSVPSPMTLGAALDSFGFMARNKEEAENNFRKIIESNYRTAILKNKKNYQNSVKLGLDLSGGINVIVKADLDAAVNAQKDSGAAEEQIKREVMENAITTLTNSIDQFGLSSPTIRQQGEDRIYIELPGSADASQVNAIIAGRGSLSFRLVNEQATSDFNEYYKNNKSLCFDDNGNLTEEAAAFVPEGYELLGVYETDEYGLEQRNVYTPYAIVDKVPALDGQSVTAAEVGREEISNKIQVNFRLNEEGAKIFADFTTANKGRQLCIVSDGKIKSIATINDAITGGSVALTGSFSAQEADNLRKVLKTAVLNVPLSIESQQSIGAALGAKSIRQGIMAIGIGLIAIMIFMLIWYKGAGVNACVAQILNLYIMFSILSALNLTLTLPMIAGMILTIGMAVDANVIIFERIKEELALGKERAAAIANGFDDALWAILDSNITTFIAAAFMSQLGSGAIQGFAYSLAIGVVSTLFTALVVSRLIFDFGTEAMHKKSISISWRIK